MNYFSGSEEKCNEAADRLLEGKLLISDSCSETSAEHIDIASSEDESSKNRMLKKKLRLHGLSSSSDDDSTDSDDEKHNLKRNRNGKYNFQ